MSKIKCLLCNSSQNKKLFEKKGIGFLQCLNCGFVFLEKKIPSLEIYQADYFNIGYGKTQAMGYRNYLADKPFFDKYFENHLDTIEFYKKPGRILDVGCAYGFFLALAKKRGWQVHGIEPAKKAAAYVKNKYGFNIFNSPAEKAKFKKAAFDVVTIIQTIEHLDNPVLVLNKVNKWLTKDGLILITAPNSESYLTRLMGRYWFEYKPDEHNYYFTPKTLDLMLTKTGFQSLFFKRDSFSFSIEYLLERALYYFKLDTIKGLIGKSRIKNSFVSKPLIPLYLSGMVCVARKRD